MPANLCVVYSHARLLRGKVDELYQHLISEHARVLHSLTDDLVANVISKHLSHSTTPSENSTGGSDQVSHHTGPLLVSSTLHTHIAVIGDGYKTVE